MTAPVSRSGSESQRETPGLRAGLAEAHERLELDRREVTDLSLTPAERREVESLFAAASAAWASVDREFEAGRVPGSERCEEVTQTLERTRDEVQTILGPGRVAQLAALRRTPRGGGRAWSARLRLALRNLRLVNGQPAQVEEVLAALRAGVDALPAAEPSSETEAGEVRRRVQALIDATRAGLSKVLSAEQMQALAVRVPTLSRSTLPTSPAAVEE